MLTAILQMWEEIKGSDGIVRTLQWTARVEGDGAITKSLSKSPTQTPLPP